MKNRKPIVRVLVEGRSWLAEKGLYAFEATVDGEAAALHVTEDVAFDLLGAWTMSDAKCLDILRLHRASLAENLQRKLHAVGHPDDRGFYVLTLKDIERTNPIARDQQRGNRSTDDQLEKSRVVERRTILRHEPERALEVTAPPVQPPSVRPGRH